MGKARSSNYIPNLGFMVSTRIKTYHGRSRTNKIEPEKKVQQTKLAKDPSSEGAVRGMASSSDKSLGCSACQKWCVGDKDVSRGRTTKTGLKH